MKSFTLLVAALFLASLGTACTFQSMTAHTGQGRVIVKAAGAAASSGAARAITGQPKTARALGLAQDRTLSASTDINSISYTVIDLATKTVAKSGTVNLSYLTLDLYLTPGASYRVIIDVDIKSTAPGTNVGVTRYGDQTEFTVDQNYDTYVYLTVHPTTVPVFNPGSVAGTGTSTIVSYDPTTGTPTTRELISATMTRSPADKVFYGPDAKLYYFNKTANAIYRWNAIATKMSSSDVVLNGIANDAKGLGSDEVQIYAACADPTVNDTLWVVGYDSTDATWHYYQADVSGNPSVTASSSISTDLEDGLSTPTIVPTGIAVDTTYSDVYITFYSTDGSAVHSGLLQYYSDSRYYFPDPQPSTVFSDQNSSIYTDVTWDRGRAWVLASPNTSLGDLGLHNVGTADILAYDYYLNAVTAVGTSVTRVLTTVPTSLASVTTLALPNRFMGPIQGSELFIGQGDFAAGSGSQVVSKVNLDSGAISTY